MRTGHRARAFAIIALLMGLSGSCAPTTATVEASVCPPAATTQEVNGYAALRAKAETDGKVRVVVELTAPTGAQPAANLGRDAVSTFQAAGVDFVEPLGTRLPFIVAEVTPDQLDTLYKDARFGRWSEDRIAVTSLAESGPLVQAPQLWAAGGRGQGQAVAILDTGVDSTHPFLAGRVVLEACFSTTSSVNSSTSACPNGQSSQVGAGAARPCSAAGCEHGTHVAGIAAGRGTDFSGMAPDANIVAVQVFSVFTGAQCGGRSPCVASFTSDQIRALDFVLQNAQVQHVAAANMSLGGGRSTTACDSDLTKPVIDQLRAAGVATVIASGNEGYRDSVSFPGCISTAVTVGATSKQDELAPFSNCGPQVDLHAPGVNIRSSVPGGGFAVFSGTSMATPHVTGAFAALRSARPSASIDQIENALKSSGVDVGGRPRIQLFDALTAMGGAAAAAEHAMVTPASDAPHGFAELASMPSEQKARFIVTVPSRAGLATAESAAQASGIDHVERMGSQPMLVIEATPNQVRALMQSGAITAVQVDRAAHTQP